MHQSGELGNVSDTGFFSLFPGGKISGSLLGTILSQHFYLSKHCNHTQLWTEITAKCTERMWSQMDAGAA